MQFTARNYANGELIRLTVDGQRIASVEEATTDGDINDFPYIAPGLFDLQINGHGGVWFSKEGLTADDVVNTLGAHFQFGITRMCPTLVTNSHEALASGFAAINEACNSDETVEFVVPGCHLEGPFISPEDGPRGAHPLEHVRPADWDEFQKLQEISGNRIRLVTLAPEVDGAIDFISKATEAGVVVAIGHTNAEAKDIEAAVEAGAKLSTHLGNGAHGMIRRHPNYIWEQLGCRELWASIITDGHHLPPSVVRTIVDTKTPQRTIITCDAAGLAGCPPGPYQEGSMSVEILEDGRIVIAGQRQLLAGSASATHQCVANAMAMAGVSLRDAFDMAGANPARLLGFEEVRLEAGCRADLVVFRHDEQEARIRIVCCMGAGIIRFAEE